MSKKDIEIETLLANLRNNYLAELPARFDEIDNAIVNFNSSIDKVEAFEALYRNIHSIKGSSGTHNLHIFSTICHDFEDVLSNHKKDLSTISNEDLNEWLRYVDLLKKAHAIINNHEIDFSTIEDELNLLRQADTEIYYRCLLVAPTKLQKQICEPIFEKYNTSMSVAADGYEALGRLLTSKYDFVITNHEISMLNGIALIAAIRTSANHNKDIQAVLMTSNETLSLNRHTDPDYILIKNSQLPDNLAIVVREVIEYLQSKSK